MSLLLALNVLLTVGLFAGTLAIRAPGEGPR